MDRGRGPLPSLWAVIVTEDDGHESIISTPEGVVVVGLEQAVRDALPEAKRGLDAAGFVYSSIEVREYKGVK